MTDLANQRARAVLRVIEGAREQRKGLNYRELFTAMKEMNDSLLEEERGATMSVLKRSIVEKQEHVLALFEEGFFDTLFC